MADRSTRRGPGRPDEPPEDAPPGPRAQAAPSPRSRPRPRFELPGYDVRDELGAGGFAAVYLARQVALDRLVALKRLLQVWDGDDESLERFRREAQVLGRLNHPGIVHLYDVVGSGSDLILVMEYVPGRSLDALAGGLPPAETIRVLRSVAEALDYAHRRGVIHRDIKPSNVFMTSDGRCKLGDFGLARVLGDTVMFRTDAASVIGTPTYMSPEQFRGDAALGPATDVYSLGVMAYELLVGRAPFVGAGLPALMLGHLDEAPPAPSELVAGFPPGVASVLMTALAKDPEARPGAVAFADALAGAAPSDWHVSIPPPVAPSPGSLDDGPATRVVARASAGDESPLAPARPAEPERGAAPAGPRGRSRRWWAVAGMALVVLGGGLAAVLTSGGGGGAGGVRVVGVRVDVQPSDGVAHCPRARFVFTATVTTNGRAGQIRYRWQEPNGSLAPEHTADVGDGARTARFVLRFSYVGSTPTHGVAMLQVAAPASVSSAPVSVDAVCP
jgi:predicted Ser/Thr protein kinase